MGKVKTSVGRKKSSVKSKPRVLVAHDPFSRQLADPKLIKKAVLQALVDGDIESVRDVLIAHLQTVNKASLAAKAKIGRQTLYDLMDSEKEFNPSIKTLSTLLNTIAA